MASIFAMPLATYAMGSIFVFLRKKLFHSAKTSQRSVLGEACTFILIMAIAVLGHYGNFRLPAIGDVITPFGVYRATCRNVYDRENQPLAASERTFIDQAKEVTGNSVVLSYPGNGTAAAYGVDGINTLYREAAEGKYDEANKNNPIAYDKMIIAYGADKVATDATVRSAMQDVGARYVLVLPMTGYDYDYDQFANQSTYPGLLAVDEDTPGYRLVMEDNGMKLLEITAVEE